MAYSSLGALGSLIMHKVAGVTTGGMLAVGSETLIPFTQIQPYNPNNFQYPGCCNASSYQSVKVAGNKTPSIMFRTYWKTSWMVAALLTGLMFSSDSNGYTDLYSFQLNTQYWSKIWDLGRCTLIVITQSADGGPIIVDFGFNCVYGDNESSSPPTFTTTPATDGGTLVHKAQVDWNSTADQVKGFMLTLSRVQAWQFSDNKTLYAEAIGSGGFAGSLMLTQSDTNTVSPSSGATIKIGAVSAGVQFALNLSTDNPFHPVDFGFLKYQVGYTLFNAGAQPCTITAM